MLPCQTGIEYTFPPYFNESIILMDRLSKTAKGSIYERAGVVLSKCAYNDYSKSYSWWCCGPMYVNTANDFYMFTFIA